MDSLSLETLSAIVRETTDTNVLAAARQAIANKLGTTFVVLPD
jgi:hypothetical protein